jgi:hypothetical protein
MKTVTLTKMRACENPDAPTCEDRSKQAQHIPEDQSPWTGYTVKGEPVGEPKVGRCFFIKRAERNGAEIPGMFRTSPITDIAPINRNCMELITRNSVYRLESDE